MIEDSLQQAAGNALAPGFTAAARLLFESILTDAERHHDAFTSRLDQ